MNKQPEDKTATTITSEQPSKQPATGELTEKELDKVSGGGRVSAADESPKETVTFEYGGLQVSYAQQNANGT